MMMIAIKFVRSEHFFNLASSLVLDDFDSSSLPQSSLCLLPFLVNIALQDL